MTRRAIGVSERPPLLQTIPLSLQHLFAMFGATVLVPVLFHINPATVLLFNGIGTLLYLFICKGKIPAYLGSSFAFISPVLLLLPLGYEVALGGFIMCGVLFCLVSFIVKKAGTGWLDVMFPPAAMAQSLPSSVWSWLASRRGWPDCCLRKGSRRIRKRLLSPWLRWR
ncbi:uracil permease [Salmonella enterica subsp. arizonae]|nr:uracil permease [Salmonella enterica subsp. arizonae]